MMKKDKVQLNINTRNKFVRLQDYYGFSCNFASTQSAIHGTAISKWLKGERDLTEENIQRLEDFLKRYPDLWQVN